MRKVYGQYPGFGSMDIRETVRLLSLKRLFQNVYRMSGSDIGMCAWNLRLTTIYYTGVYYYSWQMSS